MKATCKRVDGGYEYKGYFIYKTSIYSNAYNPWKISGVKFGHATLADAKQEIDRRTEGK